MEKNLHCIENSDKHVDIPKRMKTMSEDELNLQELKHLTTHKNLSLPRPER